MISVCVDKIICIYTLRKRIAFLLRQCEFMKELLRIKLTLLLRNFT